MLYIIMGQDRPDSLSARQAVRTAHLERLQMLQNQGRLVIAGPFPAIDSTDPGDAGFTGSLIVAEFVSLAEAKEWANADPYVIHHVYRQVSVYPFCKVLPA